MKYLKISLFILAFLSVSRFIPHPPNFTSLIALSFYVPFIFGFKFIPVVILSFAITDLYFGFHSTTFFTWGSVLLIGLIAKYLCSSIYMRIIGTLCGASIFFIISNFGVWLATGSYEYNVNGLVLCYTLAIPFFYATVLSTILFSIIFETLIVSKRIYDGYFKQSMS